jgi:hypothetical protein
MPPAVRRTSLYFCTSADESFISQQILNDEKSGNQKNCEYRG